MKFKIYRVLITGKTRLLPAGWRWRLKGRNGKIVDASTEAFSSKQAARNNAKLTRDGLIEADL